MTNQANNFEPKDERNKQLAAMQIQLRSQRASDILRGMTLARQWLQENAEDGYVYEILLDAVQENHDIRDRVRNLFFEMLQKGSKSAEEAISILPSTPQDLLADADDAYYAAEYGRAVQIYLQVLKRVPDHERAREYLAKAMSAQQDGGDLIFGLPREAVQYYRRARSYLAAGDFLLAIKSLGAATEAAQARGLSYPDAEELLKTAQDSLIADEYKQKANLALENGQFETAMDFINKGLALNLADTGIQKELSGLRDLLRAELEVRNLGALKVFMPLRQIQRARKSAENVVSSNNPLMNLVAKQLLKIRLFQIGVVFALFISIFLFLFPNEVMDFFEPENQPTATLLSVTPTEIVVSVTIPASPEIFPSMTATVELTSTPTTIPVLGYGKLTEYTYPFEKPSGFALSILLSPKQFVTIIERQEYKGNIWYKCRWELNNNTIEGWLLEKYIQFSPPPTSTPTP